jgi:hypothetical protein
MHSTLATTDHTRGNWPFPPAPPTKALALRRATHLRVVPAAAMPTQTVAQAGAGTDVLSKRQMIGDICLVLMWGAMIPGLLWLGHAVGY